MQKPSASPPDMRNPELRRALGPWSTAAIVVGTAIGSAIFLVPTQMIRAVGSPAELFAVWIFGGVLTLFGALTYAELSAAMPGAGGEYVYLSAAYGPFFGFIYGWTQTWVAKAASIATLATGFFTYLGDFFPSLGRVFFSIPAPIGPHGGPLEIRYDQLVGIALILALSGLNVLGVKVGGGVQVAVTAIKVSLLGGLILLGLLSGRGDSQNFHSSIAAQPGGVSGFFLALVAALWAYDGWNNAGMLGSEIDRPQKNLPRALISGTLAMMAIYLLVNITYFYVLNSAEVGASERVAADAMRRVLGAPGAAMVSIAAMISIFAALNGSILSGSRIPYAMARDGYFFAPIRRVNARFRTPGAAIVLLGAWSSVVLLSGQYEQLYTLVIFPSWILYGMTAASVIVLRRTRPNLERPYRVLGYPVVPLFFVLVASALLYSTFRTSPRESGMGLTVIILGLPFYFQWKRGQTAAAGTLEANPEPFSKKWDA
ncbi:MAG TPA: amino acid permease [Bryobacteraceae bacterium]|nr:amino acid permease [Bryobacteraceae bacterium]